MDIVTAKSKNCIAGMEVTQCGAGSNRSCWEVHQARHNREAQPQDVIITGTGEPMECQMQYW